MEKWSTPVVAALAVLAFFLADLFRAEYAGLPSTDGRPVPDFARTDREGPDSGPYVPLVFVANAGQLEIATRFQARIPGLRANFRSDGFQLVFDGPPAASDESEGAAVSIAFEGTSRRTRIEGGTPSRARVNYLHGARDTWLVDVPTYEGIAYRDLYPGIELAVYERHGLLEYDLVLEAGADLEQVVLSAPGAELDAVGDLVWSTAQGNLRQSAPTTFQVHRDGTQEELASRYERLADGRFGFRIDGRSPELACVIDPVLSYSTYVGGSNVDEAHSVALDGSGAMYVTGWSRSGDFPVEASAVDRRADSDEAVVFKLDPGGRGLEYATFIGGGRSDKGQGIAVNEAGEAYVCGLTKSTDFPVTAGAFRDVKNLGMDAFVLKLAADGRSLLWSTFLGGGGEDVANDIALDEAGCVYLCGTTRSRDYPITWNAFQWEAGGERDAFVTKFEPDGSALVWSSYLGGRRHDEAFALAVDRTGCAYVTGETHSVDFPTTAGALDDSKNDFDAFVTKVHSTGRSLVFSTYLGGRGRESGKGIAVNKKREVFVCGFTTSDDFPATPGAFQEVGAPGMDGFVAKLAKSGEALVYATYVSGSEQDGCTDLGLDAWELPWVSGITLSDDLPVTEDALEPKRNGMKDGFVVSFDETGSELAFGTFLGGSGDDHATAICVEPSTGFSGVVGFARDGLATDESSFAPRNSGLADGFVIRLDHGICPTPAVVRPLSSGCGAELVVSEPRIGRVASIGINGASPLAPGFLFLSPPGRRPPHVIASGCLLFIDPGGMRLFRGFQTDGEGSYEERFPIQGDPSACGLELILQGAVFDPQAGPLSFGQLTGALHLTLGS